MTTLTCEHVDELLASYFEGDLGEAERRAVDAHLRGCLRCTAIVRDIEGIRHDAAILPELEPSRDLWTGIAARIEAPVIDLKSRAPRAPVRTAWRQAAAAVVLMALSSGVTYVVTRPDVGSRMSDVAAADTTIGAVSESGAPNVVSPRPAPRAPSTPPVLISDPAPTELVYDQEIARLRKIVDERRRDLDAATIAAVERSLRAIDVAIKDARTALATDTSSPFLNEQLNRALEKKVGVLRRVALMPAGAS